MRLVPDKLRGRVIDHRSRDGTADLELLDDDRRLVVARDHAAHVDGHFWLAVVRRGRGLVDIVCLGRVRLPKKFSSAEKKA